ncbi:3'-5' exoribonuclease 1-like [Oppia nitens]|uniref:3'-5' exoribonuclease 1-like n=1 Tax=Oppia nitens TaxID=1686743 RepID=UPI0023DC5FDB|nr:3'-5' exoribonuclease 1-like [Oppia nitens]
MDQTNCDNNVTNDDIHSHSSFKKLAKINGMINDMTIDELRHRLSQLTLEVSGSEDSCRRRLKNHYRNETMKRVFNKSITYYYDIICVVDFEATCDSPQSDDLIQEIIEFPAVLVDVKQRKIVSTFHEFVKPKSTQKLSEFCTKLTGISQSIVDKSQPFVEVLDKFDKWFNSYINNNNIKSYAFATDGPWDLCHFFALTCKIYDITLPSYARQWINIRKVFTNQYKRQQLSLDQMLTHLGMEFKGRKHYGFDDAINIANLLIRMITDGANPTINQEISCHKSDRNRWTNIKCGYVSINHNKSSINSNDSDSDNSTFKDINNK